MKITKVELLWSRACPYRCAGCAMPLDNPDHQGTIKQWQQGVRRMRELGSQFVAIYGAEPLTRPVGLAEVIREIYAVGMKATVITALPKSPLLRKLLNETPLDSITVSWDGTYGDEWREKKSMDGQHALHDYKDVRDRAVVATVSHLNVDQIVDMAKQATAEGWWFLFDLYHPGSGELSKCNNEGGLQQASQTKVHAMAKGLLEFKRAGGKVHASEQYLEFLQTFAGSIRQMWHCHKRATGWLTIDSDGSIMPCDDWQVKSDKKIWDEIDPVPLKDWRDDAVSKCPGCAWNTHFHAVGIEEGTIPITTYVH